MVIGIPDSVVDVKTHKHWSQLVDTLVEQINGTIKLIRKKRNYF